LARPTRARQATIDAFFADHVKNEADAPEVVYQRKLVELHREKKIPLLREIAAKATADLNAAIDEERNLEAQVTMAKAKHLGELVRQAQAIVDGEKPPGKPNGKRPRRGS
jgi:hypothetical protein